MVDDDKPWPGAWQAQEVADPLVKDEAVRAAADWWVDTLKADATTKATGDKSNPIAVALTIWLQRKATAKADVEAFRRALCQEFASEMWNAFQKASPRRRVVVVGMDYTPKGALRRAARLAQVQNEALPTKAWMRMTPEYIEAACGYRAEPRVIWGTRPAPVDETDDSVEGGRS